MMVSPDVERALLDSEELVLVTRGRRSGREREVTVRFAYDDGKLWLRAGGHGGMPDAMRVGVRRGRGTEDVPDWYRNLVAEPRCRVTVNGHELAGVAEPIDDPAAALRRVVELWREKYGAQWVSDWYVDVGRMPVVIRIVPAAREARA